MASSSSSVSQSWNHDVFLSFRGEDTRKGFVDHLYTALVQQGIYTYKDDETLGRGEIIGPALLKAIEESRIAVIVFSKNYADSSWCLDELTHIMDCMENKGQIVMPVFYDVDPSDVRKQNGKYGEAFEKHERENKDKVELWRKALIKAGNLSGWVPRDFANGHEAKCVKDIVGAISKRLSLQLTNVNKDLIGIETRLLDLKSKMEIGAGGVRMVGIWGVGGGGKTTLAWAAYTEISDQFEAHCFVENIRDESSKHDGLKKLQEKILSVVLKTQVKLESEIEGKSMIERRLRHKCVLVVLDDVDNLKQLKALAGSYDWFGGGSRIIITTRDEHILSREENAVYEVALLSNDEAIKLFGRHAYREKNPVENYEMLSQEVVSYAGGLPLALEILGSFLYDKDNDEWKSVLAKLKSIPDQEVMERLKISYDGLKHDEQSLFLDIACYFRRWKKDEAMILLHACSVEPRIGVKVLEQKSLIKISYGRLEMHDLVEEMAHYIVRGEHPNDPEKYSRIWQKKDIVELCAMGPETLLENIHNEVLILPTHIKELRFSSEERYLPLPNYVSHQRLPDVVAKMKKLRLIYWEGYPASSLPTNFQPKKLGYLVLIKGRQNQLWQGCKVLPNLKILDLSYSEYLMSTPDFNGLPCLERLILVKCEKLKEIDPSIGYHRRLVHVNMTRCQSLKTFPPIKRMPELETLNLSWCQKLEKFPLIKGMPELETLNLNWCYKLQKFPDIETSMDSLVNLCLRSTGIRIIPPSVGQFCTNLVSFDLSYCDNLRRIECNFHLLKSLQVFDLRCCKELSTSLLTRFTKHIGLLQDNSTSLKFLQFPCFFKKLDLGYCNLGDGDIPSDLSELLNLQVLDLSGNNFSRLHSTLSRIPCLKFLDLSFCYNLVELPELPSSIAILRAEDCKSVESVGDLSKYKWLRKVDLSRVDKLIDGKRAIVHSLLQGNALEDRFMSVTLPHVQDPSVLSYLPTTLSFNDNDDCCLPFRYTAEMSSTDSQSAQDQWEELECDKYDLELECDKSDLKFQKIREKHQESYIPLTCSFTLQLPHNWYSDFSGFLFCADSCTLYGDSSIAIRQKEISSTDSQPAQDQWEEFDKNLESYEYGEVGYVPFASLSHIPWWNNSTYTKKISFEITGRHYFKVGLVPRKSKSVDSSERAIEFWDEEYEDTKTFQITEGPYSGCTTIEWCRLSNLWYKLKNTTQKFE